MIEETLEGGMSYNRNRVGVGRAIVSIVAGFILGQIAQLVLSVLLDMAYGNSVTAGRWPFNSANVILTCLVALITGFIVGRFAKARGKLLAAITNFLPLTIFIIFSIIINRDPSDYIARNYDTQLSLWVWIGLVPAIIGGHFGVSSHTKELFIIKAFGKLLQGAGVIIFAVCGLWGFFLCLGIISKAAGFWGLVVALMFTPIAFLAAPLYAGFTWGNWFPLFLNYGGSIVGALLFGIGSKLSVD
jgi:hypothetical protein